MKSTLLKLTGIVAVLAATSTFAQAQNQKMGDNLGNHKATKDLNMGTQKIFNTSGIAIGSTTITNNSVALSIEGNKAITVTSVADTSVAAFPLADRLPGMLIYYTGDNKFYVYQGTANAATSPATWVTFALSLATATDGTLAAANANGFTLTNDGQATVLRLAPASLTTPGIVTFDGTQVFGGVKTFAGNVNVGTAAVASPDGGVTPAVPAVIAATTLNGTLGVTGVTTLTGNVGTTLAPVSGLVIKSAVASTTPDTESFLSIDNTTGEVRVSTAAANAFFKQKIAVDTLAVPFALGQNEAVQVVFPATNILQNDGVIVNFDAADLAATPALGFLSIINSTATADGFVSITLADFRQVPETGTALVSAKKLLQGRNFTVTRYRQAAPVAPITP